MQCYATSDYTPTVVLKYWKKIVTILMGTWPIPIRIERRCSCSLSTYLVYIQCGLFYYHLGVLVKLASSAFQLSWPTRTIQYGFLFP